LLLMILPLFLLIELIQLGGTTGKLVNEIAQLRLERIMAARDVFHGAVSIECRQQLRQIEQLIRLNADERFYSYHGLILPQIFFVNEHNILELSSKLDVCPAEVQQEALTLTNHLFDIDEKLVLMTIEYSTCDAAYKAHSSALNARAAGDLIAYLIFLQQATEATC